MILCIEFLMFPSFALLFYAQQGLLQLDVGGHRAQPDRHQDLEKFGFFEGFALHLAGDQSGHVGFAGVVFHAPGQQLAQLGGIHVAQHGDVQTFNVVDCHAVLHFDAMDIERRRQEVAREPADEGCQRQFLDEMRGFPSQ